MFRLCVGMLGCFLLTLVFGSVFDSSVDARVRTRSESYKPKEMKKEIMPFILYDDITYASFIPSGYMGDFGVLKLDTQSVTSPKVGARCISVRYSSEYQEEKWAGVYWQNPALNWGDKNGGKNLSKAKFLTFWARGESGKEVVIEFGIGGIESRKFNGDSGEASIGPIFLSKKWEKYIIDLKKVNLKQIIGGFFWIATIDDNPNGLIFYLDEIKYTRKK